MIELLKYGGDVEMKDSYHHPPLALTTDYEVRQDELVLFMVT